MDRRGRAVALHEDLGGAVDVEIGDHAGDYNRVEADLCRAMSAFALISSASPPGADSQGGGAAGPV